MIMKMLIAYESVFRARKANSGNNCKTMHCLYIMAKEKIWKVGHFGYWVNIPGFYHWN